MLQLLLGVFSGSITPVQTAVNARLGRSVGSPLRASMVSFSVGLLSMLAIVLATGLSVVVGYGGGRPMVDVARRCVRRDVPDRQRAAIAEIR